MGFPLGYSELPLPKLLLHIVFFLAFFRRLVSRAFDAVGVGELLESEAPWPEQASAGEGYNPKQPEFQSVSTMLILEILPVVRFEDLLAGEAVTDGCAVCLYEFEAGEEVRRLNNCRHVFHRGCLDRWTEHEQRTCPLCRTLLIPEEMQEAFNRRIWAVAGVQDPYAAEDYSSS